MGVLAIIPARGGSKGVVRKNIRPLGGKPLIAWTIETALACPALTRAIVSTDDPEIAEVARRCGAEVPFLRPAEWATDTATDIDVCRHALNWMRGEERDVPDIVVWLRPTVPFRSADDIAGGLAVLLQHRAGSVRSVCTVEHHPYWMKVLDGHVLQSLIPGADERQFPRRQLLPEIYRLNGAVDITRTDRILAGDSLFEPNAHAYVMPASRSIDIDTEADFAFAEYLVERGTTCA